MNLRRLAPALPVLVPVVVVLGIMVRYADRPDFPNHEVPEGFVLAPPPSTLPPGAEHPPLPAVPGSSTTLVPANTGRARIAGYVQGPDGFGAPGVLVRVERAIGGGFQVLDLATDATGRFDVAGIGGGRYRVRAFLAPTLAQRRAEVFFLADGDTADLNLSVESFGVPSIAVAVAPQPTLLDQPLNLVVRVTGRFVDENGFVRVQPLVGGLVDVVVAGSWVRDTPDGTLATGEDGSVQLRYTCRALAGARVDVSVQATADAVPTTASFDQDACVDPATLTTTTLEPPPETDDPTSTTDPVPTTAFP